MEEVSQNENIIEEYNELYNELVTGGMTHEEAFQEVVKVKQMESIYRDQITGEEADRGITIRLQYSKADILSIVPNYNQLSEKEKNNFMWLLGFNTRKAHLFEEERYHINLSGQRVYGTVIYGTERMDKEWLKKLDSKGRNVASDEARSYWRMKNDPGYREDVRKLNQR